MNEHTKEPWHACCSDEGAYSHFIFAREGEAAICAMCSNDPNDPRDEYEHLEGILTVPERQANARRIVACVNACAGISTEELERGVIKESMDMVDRLSRESTALPTDCAGQNCAACANPCDKYIESLR